MSRQMPIINASEVGRYAYCPRAWWLYRVEGLEPADTEALRRGQNLHRRHFQGVRRMSLLRALAYLLWALAGLAGLMLFLYWLV
ncbi:MAG: hypothetical protein ACUVWB_05510 [Anaerolineae bacterium]